MPLSDKRFVYVVQQKKICTSVGSINNVTIKKVFIVIVTSLMSKGFVLGWGAEPLWRGKGSI